MFSSLRTLAINLHFPRVAELFRLGGEPQIHKEAFNLPLVRTNMGSDSHKQKKLGNHLDIDGAVFRTYPGEKSTTHNQTT